VDELFELMARGLLLPYLDIPFQHANRRILKLMKRPASGEDILRRIEAWRAACPDLSLRSTFIAGFPSESEAEFQELLDFLTDAKIDRAGCFAYSPVEGASANRLDGALPASVREERRDRLMAHQAAISHERLKRWKGRRLKVLIDTIEHSEDGQLLGAIGRTAADAPEIDGVVYLRPHPSLAPGQFVTARITRSDHYDLYGSVVRSSH
jgi:ribosomal protein S12 methylthiotransferase